MPAPTPQDVRHEMLGPYLQRVGAFLRAHGDENRPITIPSGTASLSLSAEERRAAWSILCNPRGDWAEPQGWIALGAGLHLAIDTLLQGLSATDRSEPEGEPEQHLAALREAAAAFTEGLREAIYGMVAAGRADEAKRLSSFRNKLQEILAALRNAGAEAPPPAIEIAVDAPEAPAADEPPAAPAPEPAAEDDAPAGPDPELAARLQRAAAFLRARGNQDRPLAVNFGRRTLSVGAWERRVLWSSLCEGRAPAPGWQRLIPDSVALQLAMLLSLEELERPGRSPEAAHAARTDLEATVKLAAGVVEGFRAEIARAVASGAVDDAKLATAARGGFATTLADARRALAEEPAALATASAGANSGGVPAAPVVAPPPTVTAERNARAEKLKPFLARAEQLLAIRGREDRPLAIPVGRRSWSLDPWERQVVWKVLCEDLPGQPEWSFVVAEGAAAQLAALLALERLGNAGEAPDARAATEADRDVALALLSEVGERLRAAAEAATADGKEKLGERLALFRAKLVDSVQALKRTRG